MHYEIGKIRSAVIDDKGVHITEKKLSRFVPFENIIAVSVRKPGVLTAGHIFFQTAADSNNPLTSYNAIPFKGKGNYELACEIKEAVEKVIIRNFKN